MLVTVYAARPNRRFRARQDGEAAAPTVIVSADAPHSELHDAVTNLEEGAQLVVDNPKDAARLQAELDRHKVEAEVVVDPETVAAAASDAPAASSRRLGSGRFSRPSARRFGYRRPVSSW